jgi:Zn-dependent M28 family amino/carboxypeptidase
MNNVVAIKQGESDEQIIVGAHFDGDGTGDNGSGVALNLTTAQHIYDVDTYYTIVFIFFNAEEIGCYGSTAYANAMTEEEIAKTKYMINMDSLVCGDYCNLYGGVQDDETQTVKDTEAYDNAMKVAEELGLKFYTNPWTYDTPAPGYETPDYASPSTGDWSDHKGFKNVGIKYLYFEATNWFIPGPYEEYDGYGETYLIGMLMNTPNDYLEYIEKYFPGRVLSHITKFSTLLNALLTQGELDF